MWGHQVREGLETQSFDDAIDEELSGVQRKLNHVSYGFNYCKLGFASNLLLNYQQQFGEKNVLILNYDDLCNSPAKLMKRIFSFLNIDDQFTGNWNKKYNISGIPKYSVLHDLLNSQNLIKKCLRFPFKLFLTQEKRTKLWNKIRDWNIRTGKVRKMNKTTRIKLQKHFQNEIFLLEKIMKCNLSHWNENSNAKRY